MSMRKSSGIVKNLLLILNNAVIKFFKRCRIFLAVLIIIAALLSSLFRALTPWVTQYKTEIEHHLSTLLGEPVTISSLETGWYWFEPVLKLKQVKVIDSNREVVKLKKLLVGINLFSSLWHWQIQPGVLYIEGVNLTARQKNDRWRLDGLSNDGKQRMSLDSESYTPVLAWILAQQKIIIKRIAIQVHMQDGTVIPIHDFNLLIANRSGRYRIKGGAYLKQKVPTAFKLLAELSLDPYQLQQTKGQLYLGVENVLPAQWQGFVASSKYRILDGQGDVQLWLDLASGGIEKMQARIDAKQFVWQDLQAKIKHDIAILKANLSWNLTQEGWQLAGDNLGLQINGRVWPQNNLRIQYQRQTDEWTIYVKHLVIESLLDSGIKWPDSLTKFLTIKPKGLLNDSQIHISKQTIDYILAQFVNLSWQGWQQYPGMSNLSGVIHWQPSEGQLDIDSHHVVIKPQSKPPVTFSAINAAFNWQALSQGLDIKMDRMVLRTSDLALSAHGLVDHVTRDKAGNIDLKVELSATNARHWLAYLPSEHLKPKLDNWLKKDIKRLNKVVADLTINGQAADFPFDKSPGQFEVNAHLSGVDLIFAPQWPLAKDMEGYIHMNKRKLEADVVYANLLDVLVDQINLRIDDVGLDHETLLLHGLVNTNASKAMAYVMASPLKPKLAALNRLQMQGPLSLDLRLEAPLYPENDDVLALGEITFKHNQVKINHAFGGIELKALNGSLQFDQEGILDSRMQTSIDNNPAAVYIKSIRDAQPRTEVRIKAKTTVAVLRDKFNLAVFALMRGELWLEGLLVLTDDQSDLDHVQIKSSLRGVQIDLPSPLGKAAAEQTPLTVNVAFNPRKELRFQLNYAGRVSGELLYTGAKEKFTLQKGLMRIGQPARHPLEKTGLQILGDLKYFDLQEWLNTFAKLPTTTSKQGLTEAIKGVDLRFQQAKVGGRVWPNLSFRANKRAQDDWVIHIEQQQVKAELHYKPAARLLSGHFDKLHLEKSTDESDKMAATLKAKDMPNLDLTIADMRYADQELGSLEIKANSKPTAWLLEMSKMKTPYYQLTATGSWQQDEIFNNSQIKANLKINNLAKSLALLHISPVVEASQGEINFQGSWPGSYADFSLTSMNGGIAFLFKNGRITHLSPETEEKLGLGKLLSILSLQTIPRRLKLDFSDLSHPGYSFDTCKGNFEIANGVMSTTNTYIDGPVAYASMKGNLDVARQLYDVELSVSPHITASLPIVATIAGGPIAGIATWVASKIINQGMQKISAYTYKITGPWKNPVVEQVSIFKKQSESH